MEGSSFHALMLLDEETRPFALDHIHQIQEKLKYISPKFQRVHTHYDEIMFDWLLFTVEGIGWEIGIQIQQVLADLDVPIIFLGKNNGLTDLNQLKNGYFDLYLTKLLYNFDSLEEFIMHFLSFTDIIDYCLILWKKKLAQIDDIMMLEEMKVQIQYPPLKSLIDERRDLIDPYYDKNQLSLDDFF